MRVGIMSRNIKGWDVRLYWNDIFLLFANVWFRSQYAMKGGAKSHGLMNNEKLKNIHSGKRLIVVGNGPSINEQDLRLLKGEITFFVNRGFLHPHYEAIQPTYHIIIDPKMATGEWPLDFLDEAAEKNPGVTFLLNGAWYQLPQFQSYKEKYNIYWLYQALFFTPNIRRNIDLTRIGVGGAVVEQGILASIYMGAKDIYIIGVDYNGFAYDLLQKSSHFYGVNSENLTKGYRDIYKDLDMISTSFRQFELIAKYCHKKGVSLVNMTRGGVLDICQRMKYEDLFEVATSE